MKVCKKRADVFQRKNCRRGQFFRKRLSPKTVPAPDKLAVCWTGKHPPSPRLPTSFRVAGLRWTGWWTGKPKAKYPKRLAGGLAPPKVKQKNAPITRSGFVVASSLRLDMHSATGRTLHLFLLRRFRGFSSGAASAGLAQASLSSARSFSTWRSRSRRLPAQVAARTRSTNSAAQASSSTCSLMNQCINTWAG